MQKWEYKSIVINKSSLGIIERAQPQFNALGADGWELIAIVSQPERNEGTAVFKRPL